MFIKSEESVIITESFDMLIIPTAINYLLQMLSANDWLTASAARSL